MEQANTHNLYEIFKSKDKIFDCKIFVGIKTTGIYCRTVCTARVPKEENCVFFSSQNEGKLLSMTIWENEESVKVWRNFAEHRENQALGRIEDFEDYKITVVTPVREYTMQDRKNAPDDSNKYFNV